jgi:Tol biopolymer transport system component
MSPMNTPDRTSPRKSPRTSPCVQASRRHRLLRLLALLPTVAAAACGGASAADSPPPQACSQACITGKTLEPDATFPLVTGRVAYHSYRSYGDGTGHLFMYELSTRQLSPIDRPEWGIVDPINPHFSPDGRHIVFMGRARDNWDVFVWKVDSPDAPVNLTSTLGGRNEDPKFSFDGQSIVIKHEADLLVGNVAIDGDDNLSISSWRALTSDGFAVEEGIPYFSADGQHIFYTRGAGPDLRIWRIDVATGAKEPFATPPPGARDYYPSVLDDTAYFFTRTSAGTGIDQLVQSSPDLPNDTPIELSLNVCTDNNSDAAPVNSDWLIFSSTGYSFNNRYGLVVGHLGDGRVWRFDPATLNIDDGTNKLGASYSPY